MTEREINDLREIEGRLGIYFSMCLTEHRKLDLSPLSHSVYYLKQSYSLYLTSTLANVNVNVNPTIPSLSFILHFYQPGELGWISFGQLPMTLTSVAIITLLCQVHTRDMCTSIYLSSISAGL